MNKIYANETIASRKGLVLGLTLACAAVSGYAQGKPKVLDFWGVGGFAHGSRTAANTLLDSLAVVMNFDLVKSEAASVMTAANLAQYSVVILNNSTESGKIFNIDQRAALLEYMKKGGFIGFHGAGDTKGSWPDYSLYLGGELSSHGGGIAKLDIDTSAYAKKHPILKDLPTTISFDEEWYSYKTNPRLAAGVKILYTLDEASCSGCTKMGDHPIMWVKEPPEGGKTFYYAMGHGNSIFQRNAFCKTVLARAITWTSKCAIQDPKAPMVDCATRLRQSPVPADAAGGLNVKGSARSLTIDTPDDGLHTVELLSLGGKRIARKIGAGSQSYVFGDLEASTVYTVVLHTRHGRQARLVPVQ
jgi:uncharacterized protein